MEWLELDPGFWWESSDGVFRIHKFSDSDNFGIRRMNGQYHVWVDGDHPTLEAAQSACENWELPEGVACLATARSMRDI